MNFGKLDREIAIEQFSTTRTASGSFEKVWTSVATIFAKVNWDSRIGGEVIEASQEQGFNIAEFTIRYCAALNANEKQRILYESEYFDILYVNEITRKTYYTIVAKRKTVSQEQ